MGIKIQIHGIEKHCVLPLGSYIHWRSGFTKNLLIIVEVSDSFASLKNKKQIEQVFQKSGSEGKISLPTLLQK